MNLCHQTFGTEEEQERYENTDSIHVNLNEHWNCSVNSSIYRGLVWTCFDFEVWWFFPCSFSVLQMSEFWIWDPKFDFAWFDLIRFWFCLLYNYWVWWILIWRYFPNENLRWWLMVKIWKLLRRIVRFFTTYSGFSRKYRQFYHRHWYY